MSIAFLYGNGGGGSGAALNFKVVGGAIQPENPKENTIWVQTSISLTTVEFSDQQALPSWALPAGYCYISIDGGYWSSDYDARPTFDLVHKEKLLAYVKPKAAYLNTDGTASGWARVNAYIYKSGAWVQFSSVFAATIHVTYPAGSTCTATDGVTTLTAPDTSGTWTCIVGNTETWTFTAVKGELTNSAVVNVTEETAYSAYLAFHLQIIRDGMLYKDFSVVKPMEVTQKDGYVLFAGTGIGYSSGYTEVDLSEYKTMVVEGTFDPETTTANLKYYKICVWDTSDTTKSYSNPLSYQQYTPGENTYTLDVTNLSGKHYVGITSVYTREQKVTNWRLERGDSA